MKMCCFKSIQNALATVVRLDSRNVSRYIVEKVARNLSDSDILRVTKDEYFTYLTPADELYDKSVLPG